MFVGPRVGEAMKRSVRWLDRRIEFQEKSGRKSVQNAIIIVQDGLDAVLREECLDEMVRRCDRVARYAIGGLIGGEKRGMPLTSLHNPFLCVDARGFCIRYILANVGSLIFFAASETHLEVGSGNAQKRSPLIVRSTLYFKATILIQSITEVFD
ncbi:hypothetical protein EI94DRAFT_92530 [Lactarius quietus]|nr:hypothetical protein EI94DRAFT_92530 [Lactarius quietus]